MNAPVRHSASDYLPAAFCVLLWGLGTPLFKYLQAQGCDPFTMAFYRTFSSAAALTLWVCYGQRRELAEALRKPGRYLALGGLFVSGLLCFIAGTYENSATLSILLTRATPLFTLLLSVLLFADERRLARRGGFILGFLLALAGVAGLSLARDTAAGAWQLTGGAGLLLFSAFIWGAYSVGVKTWLSGRPPFVASLLVFWAAVFFSFPAMLRWGDPGWILRGTGVAVAILFVSGPILMGFTEGLYYLSIRRIGLTSSTAFSLLVPLLTALYAWPLLDERPTLALAGFGLLLLGGLGLIVRARARLLAIPEDGVPEPLAGRQGAAAPAMGVLTHTETGVQNPQPQAPEALPKQILYLPRKSD